MAQQMEERFNYGADSIVLAKRDSISKVYLELCAQCNLACDMCFRSNFDDSLGAMDDPTLNRVIAEIGKLKQLKEVFIAGIGEPLLHSRFAQVVEAIKSRGLLLSIQTNGLLLSEKMIDFLAAIKVDRVVVSFEPGKLGHGANHHVAVAIKKLVKAGKQGRISGRPAVAIESVLTKDVLDKIPEMAKLFVDAGVKEFILSNLLPVEPEMDNQLLYFSDDENILADFHAVVRHRANYRIPFFNLRTERHCSFIENDALVIRYDGEIAPCYRFLHNGKDLIRGKWQQVKSHSFGNISRSTLFDIWNSRDYLWFRFVVANALYPSCLDCQLKDGCAYLDNAESDCWANSPSCGNCLWSRSIIICP